MYFKPQEAKAATGTQKHRKRISATKKKKGLRSMMCECESNEFQNGFE